MDYLKAEQIGNYKWRVLAIPFGGPKAGKDTDAQFFSPNTDVKAHWFGGKRPTIWHHNLDKTMKADSEIGVEDDLGQEDDGWWGTVWLERSHRYWAQIDKWLRDGKMYGSSGTLPQFMDWDRKTGEILVWPHVEQTLTLTPANPYARVMAAKAFQDAMAAGLDPRNLRFDFDAQPILSDLDSPPADLSSDLAVDDAVGDDAAIQRLASDPNRARAARRLVQLYGELTKNF